MEIKKREINAIGIRFCVEEKEREIARAYLYILQNDLHQKPFGFMEDVFVDESFRSQRIGSQLVERAIQEAKERGCYKIICTSRYEKPKVHELYEKIGFKEHGKEFRIDF